MYVGVETNINGSSENREATENKVQILIKTVIKTLVGF